MCSDCVEMLIFTEAGRDVLMEACLGDGGLNAGLVLKPSQAGNVGMPVLREHLDGVNAGNGGRPVICPKIFCTA